MVYFLFSVVSNSLSYITISKNKGKKLKVNTYTTVGLLTYFCFVLLFQYSAGSSVDDVHPLVDYTPPSYITLLFTDLGVLTPSAVSDELIKLYL